MADRKPSTSHKSRSLHIRFDSPREIDLIEICASRKGMKKVPWARQALRAQAREERVDEILSEKSRDASLEAVLLLRSLAGPDATEHAKAEVQHYKNKVMSDG